MYIICLCVYSQGGLGEKSRLLSIRLSVYVSKMPCSNLSHKNIKYSQRGLYPISWLYQLLIHLLDQWYNLPESHNQNKIRNTI